MSTILELPEVRARISRLNVEAFEALAEMGAIGKHAELIRGFIVEQMPKSPRRSKLVKRIFLFLMALEKAGFVVFIESSLRLLDSMPEPDVMIVWGKEKDFEDKFPTNAELIVEVAVSSAALDRENCSLYAEANIPEYWIVLVEEKQIEVYRQPVSSIYRQKRLYSADELLLCESVPGLEVTPADWFVRKPAAEEIS